MKIQHCLAAMAALTSLLGAQEVQPLNNSNTADAEPEKATTAVTTPRDPLSGGDALALRSLDQLSLDRPIGEIPAFIALGLSPETVSQPSSPRDFAASLLNGVDAQGILQTGLAVESAPFRWSGMPGADLHDYSTNWWKRVMHHTSLSLATSKASEDSKAVQLAVGLSTILYQDSESDPHRSSFLQEAFEKTLRERPMEGSAPGQSVPPFDGNVENSLKAAVAEFRERTWDGTLWSASIAPTWNSDDGDFGNLKMTGFTGWSTFVHGFEKPWFGSKGRAQFSAHLRYRQGETVPDPNDESVSWEQDSLLAAARLRVGTLDFNGFLEGGFVQVWDGPAGDVNGWRVPAGIERKLAENTWFVLSAGQEFGTGADGADTVFAIGALRFGLTESPRYVPK